MAERRPDSRPLELGAARGGAEGRSGCPQNPGRRAMSRRNLTVRRPFDALTTKVERLRLTVGVVRLGRVLFAFLVRAGRHCFVAVDDWLVFALVLVVVIGPFAAVIGALTVVTVVVEVTVLNVIVTGPHVTTVGSVLVKITWPHCALAAGSQLVGVAGVPSCGVEPSASPAPGSAGSLDCWAAGTRSVGSSGPPFWLDAADAAPTGPPTASTAMKAAAQPLRGDMS